MKTVDTKLTVSEDRLDTLVTDATDAVYLNCIDRLGKVTYREALDSYNKRMEAMKKFVDGVLGVTQTK